VTTVGLKWEKREFTTHDTRPEVSCQILLHDGTGTVGAFECGI
jgi:hypothetical protein